MTGEHKGTQSFPCHSVEAWPQAGRINADASHPTNLQMTGLTPTQAEKGTARTPSCSWSTPSELDAPKLTVRDPVTLGAEVWSQAMTWQKKKKEKYAHLNENREPAECEASTPP